MIDILNSLINVAGKIREMGRDKRELRDNALRAISHALNETYLYYRDVNAGKGTNKETEAQLSRYWAAAAIPMRHIDSELSNICEYKADYWIDPESWTVAQIKQIGIDLNKVKRKYRDLLNPRVAKLRKQGIIPQHA